MHARGRFALPAIALLSAALAVPLLWVAPAAAAPKLNRCDLDAGRPLRCGQITVPLRRADPSLGTTKVAFALRPRGDRSRPSLGTIIAADGGPGYSSTAAPFVRSVAAAMAPLLRRREIVFVDQRGTGRSDVLDCAPLQKGEVQEFVAIGLCATQLGSRYAAYTTAESAADLDAVRSALGLGRVFYYGDSYGTLLGQAYAVRFPQTLRGLILDSAYPADDPYYRTLYPAGLRGLRITCRNSPKCHGDPVRRFNRVVGLFRREGKTTDGLLSLLLQAGTLAPRSYLRFDKANRLYIHFRPDLLNSLLAPSYAQDHGPVEEFSYGLEIAVECNDYPLLWDPRASTEERFRQLSASVRGLPKDSFAPFSRSDYLFSRAAHLTNCLNWPAPPPGGLEPPVPAGWVAPTSFPTLVLAGQVDDITSVAEARQVTKRFPRSQLYVDPNRGHASSIYFPFKSPAVGVIRRFVRSH